MMGYTTSFTGGVNLSRPLTISEAKWLLEMNQDNDITKERFAMNNYLQWVPTRKLDQIVWDGQEKFYDYTELLVKVCDHLKSQGITANGELIWSGEERGDIGKLTVVDNVVTKIVGKKAAVKSGEPITLDELAKIALEQITA